MLKFFVIGLGGSIGAMLRYAMGGLDYRFSAGGFPIGTLIVNISGSFAIGFLWHLADKFAVSHNIRLFIFIGILGGYTTFSTFSLETFHLLKGGQYWAAAVNTMLSVILSVSAVFAGYAFSKFLDRVIA